MLKSDRPLRVGVLCSKRAPGLLDLIERSRRGDFEIACCLTSEEDFTEGRLAEAAGIPRLVHPIQAFHRRRDAALADLDVRAAYDAATAKRLSRFDLDVLLLSSYLYVLTRPMLHAFPERIFNVHGSDLLPTGSGGRYPGLRAVRHAIVAGEKATRASFHLVTEALDDGPVVLRSWSFPVSPLVADALAARSRETLHAYAFAHQEWMLRRAWGPLLVKAIDLFVGSELRLVNGRFYIGSSAGPWELSEHGGLLYEPRLRLPKAVGE
jgi:phosphoribosylglycinamide formyltransferase 1